MSDRLTVQIEARDGSSRVFQAVSGNAQRMGQTVEQAGTRSSRALDEANKRAVAFGAAVGAGALVLAEFGRAAAEEEAIFAGLTAAVEATGESFTVYGDAIDGAIAKGEQLAFADDQIATALNRMITASGDVQGSLDNIGIAMDFARARGIDLATAADLVGRAMAGQTQTLSRYGIVVQEGASATEVLAALQGKVAGQAEAYASTTQGSLDRIRNSFDNLTETIGAHAGPMQTILTLLPGLKVGYAALVPAVAGLAAALGPVGLVAAAVAAGASFLLLRDDADDYSASAQLAEVHTRDLETAVKDLAAAGSVRSLLGESLLTQFGTMGGEVQGLTADVDDLNAELAEAEESLRLALQLPRTAQNAAELDNTIINLTATVGGLRAELAEAGDLTESYAAAQQALSTIIQHQGPGYEDAIANVNILLEAQRNGTITLDQLFDGIVATADYLKTYDLRAIEAAESTDNLAASQKALLGPLREVVGITEHGTRIFADLIETQAKSDHQALRGAQSAERAGGAIDSIAVAAASADARLDGLSKTTAEFNENLAQATADAIAFVGAAENIDDVLLKAGKALSGEQGLIRISQDVERSQSSLDSSLDVVAGATDNLGQSSQRAAGFITDLTDSSSFLDTALKSGRITQEEYNDVLAAETTIIENNTAAQAHLDAIRAKQAPFIAEQTDAYEDQLETISKLSAEDQRLALAFVDTSTKAQIATTYSTLYAASLGEIPKDVATEMILSDAAASPILDEVLRKYEVIEEDANGKITVNFDDGPTLTTTLQELTTAIENLNLLIATPTVDLDTAPYDEKMRSLPGPLADLDGTTVAPTVNLENNASVPLDTIEMEVTEVGGMIVSPTVNVIDNASGVLSNLIGNLQFLDGFTATSTVTNTTINRTVTEGLAGFFQHGGVVPHAQHGLVTPGGARFVRMNEAGGEDVLVPGGSYIRPAPASALARGSGGGGEVHLHIYGNVYGVDDIHATVNQALRAYSYAAGR